MQENDIEKSVIKLWFVWLLGTAKVYNIMSTSFIQDIDVCFKDKAFVTCYQKAYSFRTIQYQGIHTMDSENHSWHISVAQILHSHIHLHLVFKKISPCPI